MDNYLCFPIQSQKDIEKMQKSLLTQSDTVKRYVALELAENMVDSGEQGTILVNGSEVISKVEDKKHLTEVRQAIDQAHHMQENRLTGKVNESKTRTGNLGGKGLLTILHSGWDLSVSEEDSGFSITAARCSG